MREPTKGRLKHVVHIMVRIPKNVIITSWFSIQVRYDQHKGENTTKILALSSRDKDLVDSILGRLEDSVGLPVT